MNKLERLAYWKSVAGDTSAAIWVNEEEDLFGYFQRFRPDGRGVERVFEGLNGGDEILSRLMPFYEHTKDGGGGDAYFVVRTPLVTTSQELLVLVTRYFEKIRQMTSGSEAWEVGNFLQSIHIEIEKGQCPWPPPAKSLESMVYGAVVGWFNTLDPIESDALLLSEAFYSMTCDYELAWHILWPLYRESSEIDDPFAAKFELWIRGAGCRFTENKQATVYAPSLIPR